MFFELASSIVFILTEMRNRLLIHSLAKLHNWPEMHYIDANITHACGWTCVNWWCNIFINLSFIYSHLFSLLHCLQRFIIPAMIFLHGKVLINYISTWPPVRHERILLLNNVEIHTHTQTYTYKIRERKTIKWL